MTFIAQKILVRSKRSPPKQAQDALYIHDTLELFGGELEGLRSLWEKDIRPKLHPKTARNLERLQLEQFGKVTDVLRNASRIPQDRRLYSDEMQARCAAGLDEIFGKHER